MLSRIEAAEVARKHSMMSRTSCGDPPTATTFGFDQGVQAAMLYILIRTGDNALVAELSLLQFDSVKI